ncbi:MAG: DUF4253 domain-containing protein [Planctomycetes bacterium]|nr:DUF4253 domain-containing protein [Planctomycetota bacterium]
MLQTLAELKRALGESRFATRPIEALRVLDGDELAFAVEVQVDELEDAWREARGLLERTGRWPVVTTSFSDRTTWIERLREDDPFSRFYFEQADPGADVSPRAILARADRVDVERFLEQLARERAEDEDLDELAGVELAETERAVGSHPTWEECHAAEVFGRRIGCAHDLDRFLLDWETSHGVRAEATGLCDWHRPDHATLLFLPVVRGADALAYLSWYGSATRPAELDIALARSWERRFGAELVAHYGTLLSARVERPPKTAADAWDVAREHDLVAPYMRDASGHPLRRYALELVGSPRWQLHERP